MLKKNPKYSKRINYDALKGIFDAPAPEEKSGYNDEALYMMDADKTDATVDDDGAYTMDADKNDSSTMVVIEDNTVPPSAHTRDGDDDYLDDYVGSDKEEGWDDGYEQEV
jgi:transcription factor IIIB subunit 2